MADDVKVQIVASDQTGPAFESAQGGADSLSEHMEAGFERVAERLTEFFAIEKVVEFFKESVQEFAEVQRAMDILDVSLKNNGEAWSDANEQIEAFVEKEQIFGGQGKAAIITALTDIETKVGNLHISLGLLDEAEKLSQLRHIDLATASDSLTRAFEGDQRGIRSLSRELTGNATTFQTAGEAFEDLDKKISGMDAVTDDAKGHLNSMKSAFEDFSEFAGSTFAPLIDVVTVSVKILNQTFQFIITGFKQLADLIVADAGLIIEEFQAMSEGAHGFYEILHGDITSGLTDIGFAGAHAAKAVTDAFGNAAKAMGQDWSDYEKQTQKIWYGQTEQAQAASAAEIKAQAEANQKRIDAAKKAAADEKATAESAKKDQAELEKARQKELEEFNNYNDTKLRSTLKASQRVKVDYDQYQAYVKKADAASGQQRQTLLNSEQAAYKRYLNDLTEMDKEHQANLKKADEEIKSNAEKLAGELTSLEKSKNKEVAEAAKDFALVRAGINMAVGISGALADYPYPASLAIGALVAAEGAVEIAKIEGALDTGGVVTQPTLSWVGEKRPEAVVPLEDYPGLNLGGNKQAGGGHTFNITVNGVQNASQFVNQLPGHLQRAQTRLGQRLNPAFS